MFLLLLVVVGDVNGGRGIGDGVVVVAATVGFGDADGAVTAVVMMVVVVLLMVMVVLLLLLVLLLVDWMLLMVLPWLALVLVKILWWIFSLSFVLMLLWS